MSPAAAPRVPYSFTLFGCRPPPSRPAKLVGPARSQAWEEARGGLGCVWARVQGAAGCGHGNPPAVLPAGCAPCSLLGHGRAAAAPAAAASLASAAAAASTARQQACNAGGVQVPGGERRAGGAAHRRSRCGPSQTALPVAPPACGTAGLRVRASAAHRGAGARRRGAAAGKSWRARATPHQQQAVVPGERGVEGELLLGACHGRPLAAGWGDPAGIGARARCLLTALPKRNQW